jgi:hypothetical protein
MIAACSALNLQISLITQNVRVCMLQEDCIFMAQLFTTLCKVCLWGMCAPSLWVHKQIGQTGLSCLSNMKLPKMKQFRTIPDIYSNVCCSENYIDFTKLLACFGMDVLWLIFHCFYFSWITDVSIAWQTRPALFMTININTVNSTLQHYSVTKSKWFHSAVSKKKPSKNM